MVSLEKAHRLHREFVDKMHPIFGLAKHPGYNAIRFRPLCSQGGVIFDSKTKIAEIVLNDDVDFFESESDFAYTVYHETAHCLHLYTLPNNFRKVKYRNRCLAEIIASFATLNYAFDNHPTEMREFLAHASESLTQPAAELFYRIETTQKRAIFLLGLLGKDMKEARPQIVEVLGRNHIYLPEQLR